MARKTTWVFDYLIDVPARIVGEIAAGLVIVGLFIITIYLWQIAYEVCLRKFPKPVSIVLGAAAALYFGVILTWSTHWMAFALLRFGESSD